MRTRVLVLLVFTSSAVLGAQDGNAAWVSWIRANHHPIAAVRAPPADSFADLQFLTTSLRDRRIVQLGESGHGVAEFNHAKVRLIQFLHQHMGFDVMAFESGMYECYNANTATNTALTTMRNGTFSVWHTEEARALFDYIKSTQPTSRPLVLAGFDTQMSSSSAISTRPAFFSNLMRGIDPVRAATTETADREYISPSVRGERCTVALVRSERLASAVEDQAFHGLRSMRVQPRLFQAIGHILRFAIRKPVCAGGRAMPLDNEGVVKRWWEDLWNKGNIAAADEIVSADYTNHDPASPWVPSGIDGCKTLVTGYRTVFPDINFAVEQQLVAGDTVVSHWRCTGTHKAEVMGIAATGKKIETEGISILHLENGKIRHQTTIWDALGMKQQLS